MSTIVLDNEKELLIRVANGCEHAYKELFTRYWKTIYAVAFRFTKSKEMSQDIAQDVFAKIWVNRENLREVIRFDSYLFVVARNLLFDRFRERVLTSQYEPFLSAYFSDPDLIPSGEVELKEMEQIIHSGIHQLPRQQQLAFSLSRYQGLRHQEIAVQMGITKQSVKSHMVRAIAALRKYVVTRTAEFILFFAWILTHVPANLR